MSWVVEEWKGLDQSQTTRNGEDGCLHAVSLKRLQVESDSCLAHRAFSQSIWQLVASPPNPVAALLPEACPRSEPFPEFSQIVFDPSPPPPDHGAGTSPFASSGCGILHSAIAGRIGRIPRLPWLGFGLGEGNGCSANKSRQTYEMQRQCLKTVFDKVLNAPSSQACRRYDPNVALKQVKES